MRGKNNEIMLASLLFLPKSVAVSDKIISFALTDKSEFVWNTFILLAKPFAV